MEWLLGLALAPAAVCGLMCVGGMALAAIGLRRGDAKHACADAMPASADHVETETARLGRLESR